MSTPTDTPDSVPPLTRTSGLTLPPAVVLFTALLGLALQWIIARVYVDLGVTMFGGAVARGATGLEVPISYVLTALASAGTALYCRARPGPGRLIVAIHLVAVVIPLQALVAAQFELARPEFATVVTLAFLAALAFAGLMPDIQVPRAGGGARIVLTIVAAVLTAYLYAEVIGHGGLGRLSFDLSAVYEVREEFLEHIAPLVGYLVHWQGSVINPTLILLGFRRRSVLLGGFGIGLQLLLFGMTGYRSFLLVPVLVAGLLVIGKRRDMAAIALTAVMIVVGMALGLYLWLDQPMIPALLVDRVIVIPAEIHYWYYDFFGTHAQAPLQLSQSIFAPLTAAHYSAPIAEVIGWKYMGSAASANVGLFGDAFANFGFAGCALFALLFGLVLKAVDAGGRTTDPRVAVALVGMPAFELVNSGLLTVLLTHGLVLTILVLWAFANQPDAEDGHGGQSGG